MLQVLTLAYFGARGDTATQLESVLGFGASSGVTRKDVLNNYVFDRAFFSIRDATSPAVRVSAII